MRDYSIDAKTYDWPGLWPDYSAWEEVAVNPEPQGIVPATMTDEPGEFSHPELEEWLKRSKSC